MEQPIRAHAAKAPARQALGAGKDFSDLARR